MNVERTSSKLKSLNNADLESLDWLVKQEYIRRGKVDSHGDRVNNFTSNTVHTGAEQSAGLSEMFDRAWIHG